MNYFPNRAVRMVCLLCLCCWLALGISEPIYSHSVSTPSDITSSDGTSVELVNHVDLYDDNGNFVTHLHDYSVSRYTQAEIDEIHANYPNARQRVGDVKGVSQRSYGSPGFQEPDDLDAIGTDDPDHDNYGQVSIPDEPVAEDSQDAQGALGQLALEFAFAQDSQPEQLARAPLIVSAQNAPNNEGGGLDTQGLPPLPDVTPQNPTQNPEQPTQPQATQGQPQQTGVTPQPTPQATQPQGRQQTTQVAQHPLRVTEYMVRDWSRSAGGDLPQWIELYNPNPNPILLHNCFFSYVVHQGFNKTVKHVQVDNFIVPAKKAVIFVTHAVGPNRFGGITAAQVYALNIPNNLKSGWLLRTATGGVIFKAGEEFGGSQPHAPKHVDGNRQSFIRYAEADTETAYYYGSAWDIGTPGYHEPVRAAPSVLRKKIGLWGALKQ